MLNPRTDTDFAHAMQDTTRAGSEQAGNAVQVVADICERAARAGAEILRTNVETAQQVLQSGAEMAAQLTESSVNQFGRALGLSDDGTHTAAQ
jgi:gamma-glutamyl:cysteine ligase YbdK (ATP-grasp superfamily)